uniref:Uncharacterized protein n=1 Tax=Loa loa TaxID=7209 RepID=A0A1I7VCR2_LOALO
MSIQDHQNEKDDEQALERFKKGMTKQDGRCQVCWSWKDSEDKLRSHCGLCFGRLKTLIKRLQNNEGILRRYDETSQDQLQSGIIEGVHHPDMDQEGNKKFKLSPISRTYHTSRFSRNTIALSMMKNVITDVEKAFLQLELHQSDRDCTRFLRSNDIKCAATEENLNVIVLEEFLVDNTQSSSRNDRKPESVRDQEDLYLDNVMLSANGTREAINKYHEVKDMFKKAAMNIREFPSSDQNFNRAIPKQDRIEGGATKILGITWIID